MAFQVPANTQIFRPFYSSLLIGSIERSLHLNEMKIISYKKYHSIVEKKVWVTFIVELLKFRKDSGQFLRVTETNYHLKYARWQGCRCKNRVERTLQIGCRILYNKQNIRNVSNENHKKNYHTDCSTQFYVFIFHIQIYTRIQKIFSISVECYHFSFTIIHSFLFKEKPRLTRSLCNSDWPLFENCCSFYIRWMRLFRP